MPTARRRYSAVAPVSLRSHKPRTIGEWGDPMEHGDRAHRATTAGDATSASTRGTDAGWGGAAGTRMARAVGKWPAQRRGESWERRLAGSTRGRTTPVNLANRVADSHPGAPRAVVKPPGAGLDHLWRLTSDADEVLSIFPVPRLDSGFILDARAAYLEALSHG